MKIHYKTLILNKENEEELLSKQILEKNRQPIIDYCCDEMKEAIKDNVLDITNVDLFLITTGYEGSESYYFHPIKFCPFCGEKIEQIEEYRAKLEYHKVHIPKKINPAYTEMRQKEIRIG